MATIPVKQASGPDQTETVEERFRRLAALWHNETCFLSSMSEANAHPAYQEIISLGPDVLPFMLRDLEENNTHWFAALRAITGANPVPKAVGGNIPKMAEAWLPWAKDHGYRW